jgi:hypothetical protein
MASRTLVILFLPMILASLAYAQPQLRNCASAAINLKCTERKLDLPNSKIAIRTYIKTVPDKIINRTFVVVHANEEKGLDAAKKVIAANYGRLVEVVSKDPNGNNSRYLYFGPDKSYCIDPNRIYTKKGITDNLKDDNNPCRSRNPSIDKGDKIYKFGQSLLAIVTEKDKYSLIIAIHNNRDSLSLDTWSKNTEGHVGDEAKSAYGIFRANNHRNNSVRDTSEHNFVMATNGQLFGRILDLGIYAVALQESREYLTEIIPPATRKTIKPLLDDGSMSIFFGTEIHRPTGKTYDYAIIEAGGYKNEEDNAKRWQAETIRKICIAKSLK